MKMLTLIPTRKEFKFFLKGCAELGLASETSLLGRIPVTCLPSLDLTLAEGGLGKVQFAVRTLHLIDCARDWEGVMKILWNQRGGRGFENLPAPLPAPGRGQAERGPANSAGCHSSKFVAYPIKPMKEPDKILKRIYKAR